VTWRVACVAALLGLFLVSGAKSLPRLQVQGTNFVDPAGRAVFLRGINYSHRGKHRPYVGWQREEHFDRIVEWGFNCVRLLVFWDAVEPSPGQYDEQYLGQIRRVLEWCQARGIYVVMDMHQDLYGPAFGGDGAPPWASVDDLVDPNWRWNPWYMNYLVPEVMVSFRRFWRSAELQEAFGRAWQRLAALGEGLTCVVGYDLLNEPYPGFTNLAIFETQHLSRFYTRITGMLREVDPGAIIFFEPSAMTANHGLGSQVKPPDGPAVYAPHFYDPLVMLKVPYRRRGWISRQGIRGMARRARYLGVPLFLGEYGVHRRLEGASKVMRVQAEILEEVAAAGAAYWNYNPSLRPDVDAPGEPIMEPVEGDEMSFDAGGIEHPAASEILRPYPRAVAGLPRGWRFDPEKDRFRMKWDVGPGGPTEIYLARRHFGEYPEVSFHGSWEFDEARRVLRLWPAPSEREASVEVRRDPTRRRP
jgi:endoglycosylceramidase